MDISEGGSWGSEPSLRQDQFFSSTGLTPKLLQQKDGRMLHNTAGLIFLVIWS